MLGITDLKTGVKFLMNNEPHEVMSYQHSKQARAGAVVRTRLRNMVTGAIIDKTFRGNEKFDNADVSQEKAQYLFHDNEGYHFMDMVSYEQFAISDTQLGEKSQYIKEGIEVQLVKYEGKALGIELPIKISYLVKETTPGVKGDTAQGGSKPATIETGAIITVPLFINEGDKIMVDTRDGSYLERAN